MKMRNQARNRASGYAMAALLVAIGVMAVLMTVALPSWRQMVQREKEEELIFRGRQYVRAIALFQRKYAASYPPSVEVLVQQKFLRRAYEDPMVEDGKFQVLYQASTRGGRAARPGSGTQAGAGTAGTAGAGSSFGVAGGSGGALGPLGGVIGVVSKSSAASIRIFNGKTHYNEWDFVLAAQASGRGNARPGTGLPIGGVRAAPRGTR